MKMTIQSMVRNDQTTIPISVDGSFLGNHGDGSGHGGVKRAVVWEYTDRVEFVGEAVTNGQDSTVEWIGRVVRYHRMVHAGVVCPCYVLAQMDRQRCGVECKTTVARRDDVDSMRSGRRSSVAPTQASTQGNSDHRDNNDDRHQRPDQDCRARHEVLV